MKTEPKLSMGLTTGGFEKFLRDGTGVDFRLDQDTWRSLKEGDIFEFLEDPGENRNYSVEILTRYTAQSFCELIDNLPSDIFDKTQKEGHLKFFSQWWSTEKENKYGVLALHIKVLKETYKSNLEQ